MANVNGLKKDKEFVVKTLYEYESQLNRPLVRNDIVAEKIGFSPIVITRIWGTWGNCKKELGLKPTPTSHYKPFEVYKNILDNALEYYKNQKYISWNDLEKFEGLNHKSLRAAFEREKIDLYQYIKERGFIMNENLFSYSFCFDDGERVMSSLEYKFSSFLKDLNYIYNIDYYRDVMYKKFLNYTSNSKLNCDYVFDNKYIEIAGISRNPNNDWKQQKYKTKVEKEYLEKMILKSDLLEKNNKSFLFLFPEDFIDGQYKHKFLKFMEE